LFIVLFAVRPAAADSEHLIDWAILNELCADARNHDHNADTLVVRTRSGDARLSKVKILQYLFKAASIFDGPRDENGDGTPSWRESVRALAYNETCQDSDLLKGACADGDDQKIDAIRASFDTLVQTQTITSKNPKKPGAVVVEVLPDAAPDSDYEFETVTNDVRRIDETNRVRSVYRFFALEGRVTIACRRPPSSTVETGGQAPADGATSKPSVSPWTRAGRLRSSPETAFEALNKDNKKTLKGASLSYEDKAGGATKLAADIVAGVAFSRSLAGGGTAVFLPFVDVEASNQSGKSPTDPDRVGVGFGAAVLDLDGPFETPFRLSGYAEYLTDTRFRASMGYFKMVLQPTPNINCFNTYTRWFGSLPIGVYCEADIRADVAGIMDNGGAPAFVKLGDDYARVGYRLGLSMRGSPGSAIDWISTTAGYQNLHDFSGGGFDLERFEAAVKLAPSELQLFQQDAVLTFDIGYLNGNADITLEDQEKVTVGLSLTY